MSDTATDYYAIYRRLPGKGRPKIARTNFLCNVTARDKDHALKIARACGFSGRAIYAIHIGREGYFAALRSAFPQPIYSRYTE